MSTTEATFEHVNLATVDPGRDAIKEQNYDLQVVDAGVKQYSNDKGSGEYIKIGVAITDDPNFRGRRVYNTLFPSDQTNKKLRILMDAVGIPQGNNEDLNTWLQNLQQQKARFNAPVQMFEEKDKDTGGTKPVPRINLWKCSPATS